MITDDLEKQVAFKELDDLEQKLRWYIKSIKAYQRCGHWIMLRLVIAVVQILVMIYEMTLPVYQLLLVPWLTCLLLTYIGQWVPKREAKAIYKKQLAMEARERDDHYKLLTGVERR